MLSITIPLFDCCIPIEHFPCLSRKSLNTIITNSALFKLTKIAALQKPLHTSQDQHTATGYDRSATRH